MDDVFSLPVNYLGEEHEFEARLHLSGYTHKIEVTIEDIAVLFEPDEERKYRAVVSPEQLKDKANTLSIGLLQAISMQLESLLKSS